MITTPRAGGLRRLAGTCLVLALAGCSRSAPQPRTFATPEDAVKGLVETVKTGTVEQLAAIFGPEGKALLDSSDPVAARRRREVFSAAVKERWRLVPRGSDERVLEIGNEEWPFPIPIVKRPGGWQFDAAAGKEEVIARRIGRNELAAIRLCRIYVDAQRLYARTGHDGAPPGVYARTFRSESNRHNGLYWVAARGEKRSPLGDLVARASEEGGTRAAGAKPSPFHGYYFKILTAQGPAAPGGAKDYIADGRLAGGFALVAWPSEYDVTGVMTFIVSDDGVVREQNLGAGTDVAARTMTAFNPDPAWTPVQ